MDDLYTQFLKNNDLEHVWFTQWALMDPKKKMEIPEKLLGVRIAGIPVHLNTSVKNARLLQLEIEMSRVQAEMNLRKWMKLFAKQTLDPDDAVRLTDFLYQDVLAKLMWPLEYVTKEGQLNLEEFLPIARMMEGILDEFVAAIDYFFHSLDDNELALEARVQRREEELNRSTKAWVDNAPLELRATARVRDGLFGKYLDVQGSVRSTLSSGQINAQYMADNVVAHLGVGEDRYRRHQELMNQLKVSIEKIIDSYSKRWKDCLQNEIKKIRTIFWPYIYAGGDAVLNRPDRKECFDHLYDNIEDSKDIPALIKYIKYYNFDFEDIIGKSIYVSFINHYYHERVYVDDDFDAELYLKYYGKKTFASCPIFFERFRNSVKNTAKRSMEQSYALYPEEYAKNKEASVEPMMAMIKNFPGITESQKAPLIEVVWYHYYDVLKDYKNRDKYDPSGKEKEVPVFQY